jgi:hypothetical protein
MSSPPNSDAAIRARLLNKLGIYGDVNAPAKQAPMTAAQHRRLRILRGMGVGYTLHPSPPDGSAVRPPLDGSMTTLEPLKAHGMQSSLSSSLSSSKSSTDGTLKATTVDKQDRHIMFQDQVEVIPIPTRYEYSDRIKSRIWSNRHELQENAERNAMEFAAEGWNWRTVTEDEGMYICSLSGELVHPIHLQEAIQKQQEEQAQQQLEEDEGVPCLDRGAPVHSN